MLPVANVLPVANAAAWIIAAAGAWTVTQVPAISAGAHTAITNPGTWILTLAGFAVALLYPTAVAAATHEPYKNVFTATQAAFTTQFAVPYRRTRTIEHTQALGLARRGANPDTAPAAIAVTDAVRNTVAVAAAGTGLILLWFFQPRFSSQTTCTPLSCYNLDTVIIATGCVLAVVAVAFGFAAHTHATGAHRPGEDTLGKLHAYTHARGYRPGQFNTHTAAILAKTWKRVGAWTVATYLAPFTIVWAATEWYIPHTSAGVSALEAFVAYALATLALRVRITPGALLIADAVLILSLVAAGASVTQAVAVDVTWRVAAYLPHVAVGLACWIAQTRSPKTQGRDGGHDAQEDTPKSAPTAPAARTPNPNA